MTWIWSANSHRLVIGAPSASVMTSASAVAGARRAVLGGGWLVRVGAAERTLVVATQLVQIGWDFEEGDPKTEASDGWWLWARARCSYCKSTGCGRTLSAWSGGGVDGHLPHLHHEDGTELRPAWVSELFSQLAYEAGLPPIRLHDLRHCAATLTYAASADTKMVSTMLRHSSTNLTENTYTTVLPELAHAAAEASVAIVPRAVSRTGGLPSVSQEGAGDPADSGGEVKSLVRRVKSGRAPGARTRNLRIKRSSSGRSKSFSAGQWLFTVSPERS
jgi:hypothetical protein